MNVWVLLTVAFACWAFYFATRAGVTAAAWDACKRWPLLPFVAGLLVAYLLFGRPAEMALR